MPISRHRIRLILMLGVGFLAVMHLFGLYAIFVQQRTTLYGMTIVQRFQLDNEGTIPTWYASLLLLACAVVVGLIAATKRSARDPFAHHWLGPAVMLLLLSADEGARVHELLAWPLRELTGNAGSWLPFGGVLPGALVALVIGFVYVDFLEYLPAPIARGFLASGAIWLGAALGLEAIGDWYLTHHDNDVGYYLLTGIEEVLEMLGVILALDTSLAYLTTQAPIIRLALVRTDAPAQRA